MSVLDSRIVELGGRSQTGSGDEFRTVYRVTMDSDSYPTVVLALSHVASPDPVPNLFDSYFGSPAIVCTSLDIAQESPTNYRRWRITANYTIPPSGESGDPNGPPPENPLDRVTEWSVDWESEELVIEKDRNGLAILTPAGVPYLGGFTDARKLLVLLATKNYETLEEIEDVGTEYDRAVNSAIYRGHPPRTVRFDGITAGERQWENGVSFYRGQTRMIVKPETWDLVVQARGVMEKKDGKIVAITDKDNQPVLEPVLLKADPVLWGGEVGEKLPEANAAEYQTFQINPIKDFANLNL